MQSRDQDDDRLSRSRERHASQDGDDEKTDDNDRKFFSKYNPKNVSLASLTAVCMLFILITTNTAVLPATLSHPCLSESLSPDRKWFAEVEGFAAGSVARELSYLRRLERTRAVASLGRRGLGDRPG